MISAKLRNQRIANFRNGSPVHKEKATAKHEIVTSTNQFHSCHAFNISSDGEQKELVVRLTPNLDHVQGHITKTSYSLKMKGTLTVEADRRQPE